MITQALSFSLISSVIGLPFIEWDFFYNSLVGSRVDGHEWLPQFLHYDPITVPTKRATDKPPAEGTQN